MANNLDNRNIPEAKLTIELNEPCTNKTALAQLPQNKIEIIKFLNKRGQFATILILCLISFTSLITLLKSIYQKQDYFNEMLTLELTLQDQNNASVINNMTFMSAESF